MGQPGEFADRLGGEGVLAPEGCGEAGCVPGPTRVVGRVNM